MSGFAALVVAATVVGQASNHQEMMDAWADVFVGTWVNEDTADEDLPGLAKKGDKFVTVGEFKELANGVYGLDATTTVNGKPNVGRGVVGWDASRERARLSWYDENGTSGTATYTKKGDKWVGTIAVVDPEGTKTTARYTMTVGDGIHTYHVTNRKRGEEMLDDETDIWRRKED